MSRYFSRSRSSVENRPLLHQRADTDLDNLSAEQRKSMENNLLRKLDARMSCLIILVLLSYIDRSNVAAARLRGFEEDLELKGTQYASIISVLYVGYILMQVPSNMFLSRINRPSVYLSCCIMASGMVTVCTGLSTSYNGAFITRLVLGFVEAPVFTGAIFFLGKWYKRNELSERIAYLVFGGLISVTFGTLIASGILSAMDGVFAYTGWRWIFFMEGGLAILIATASLFILPDLPESKSISWLTPTELALARRRIIEDAPQEPQPHGSTLSGFVLAFSDWKTFFLALLAFGTTVTASFLIYFPTLTATIGYNSTISLLLCAPPWLSAATLGLVWSRHSDRTEERCMHVVIPLISSTLGFLLAMSTMNATLRYASLYLMTPANIGDVCLYAWVSSTVGEPPSKRAVALAFVNAFAQGGNILGSYIWVKHWEPTYNKSFMICTGVALTSMFMCLWFRRCLRRLNQKMDLENERGGGPRESWRYYL